MADDPKLNVGDEALFQAMQGTGDVVEITQGLGDKITTNLKARMADINERYPALVAECPYETRLAVTAWVMNHIVEHAAEPGSFRYLIYNRMGFQMDAYVPLYLAGGMTISNEFQLPDGFDDPKMV